VRLRERALAQAEAHFQLRPKGSIVERCHRIEQAGWQAMYRDDLEGSSALVLSLADWSAQGGFHRSSQHRVGKGA